MDDQSWSMPNRRPPPPPPPPPHRPPAPPPLRPHHPPAPPPLPPHHPPAPLSLPPCRPPPTPPPLPPWTHGSENPKSGGHYSTQKRARRSAAVSTARAAVGTAGSQDILREIVRRYTTSAMAIDDICLAITHQTRFALRLASAISSPSYSKGSSGNTAFSPVSLHVMLSLVAAGTGGATRDQLAATLGTARPGESERLHALTEQVVQLVLSNPSGAGGPRVAFANGVFVDPSLSLKPSFQNLAVGNYKAEVLYVDFQTKAAQVSSQVNTWVEILPAGSVDATTSLVLGNTLYFRGAWAQKFDASKTKYGKFHLLDGSSVQAPFMSSTKKQYILSSDTLKVLKLPYRKGGDKRQFSMYILLPEAEDGLSNLAEKLSTEPEFIKKHIPEEKVLVGQFKLPKFNISFGFEASDLLKVLGLQLLFSAEAYLSEIVGSPVANSLYISSFFHRSFVEVNEQGTKVAAATAAVATVRSMAVEPEGVDFVADHPFLFVIREDITGVVLFIGQVANPLVSS